MKHLLNGSSMSTSDFTNILSNFNPLNKKIKNELEKITKIYPYFQTAHFYYVKSLQKQESVDYKNILEVTAIKTFDRSLLMKWVTDNTKVFNNKKLDIRNKVNVKEGEFFDINPSVNKDKINKLNFLEWISFTEKKSYLEEKVGINSINVNSFLEKNPTINKLKKDSNHEPDINFILKNSFSPEELMTETLAKIFVKQQKYNKAIQAYKILSLKYPEKNTLFADEIDRLKKLKKNKT